MQFSDFIKYINQFNYNTSIGSWQTFTMPEYAGEDIKQILSGSLGQKDPRVLRALDHVNSYIRVDAEISKTPADYYKQHTDTISDYITLNSNILSDYAEAVGK